MPLSQTDRRLPIPRFPDTGHGPDTLLQLSFLNVGGTVISTGELSRTQSLVTSLQLNGMSGRSGNDRCASFSAANSSSALLDPHLRCKLSTIICCSPSRPAVLEAVDGSSPQQQWNLSSSLSSSEMQTYQRPSSLASASEGDDSEIHFSPAASQTAQVADATSPPGADASSVAAGNTFSPEGIPPLHTATEDGGYNYNDGDSMSETSAGTAVMVGHPDDEEEDTAERRWRLAEQRGNDIRRARAPPCPVAIGTDCFLKVIVVSSSLLRYWHATHSNSLSSLYPAFAFTVIQEHKWHHIAKILAALNCAELLLSACPSVTRLWWAAWPSRHIPVHWPQCVSLCVS